MLPERSLNCSINARTSNHQPIGCPHWQVNYNGFEPEKKKKPEITEAMIDPSEIGLVAWLASLTPWPIVFFGVYWGYKP